MSTKIQKIAEGLTKLADTTNTRGVGYKGEDKTVKVTPLGLLQDNTDEFVALLQDLPEKSEIKQAINALDDAATQIEKYLNKISTQLSEVLQPGQDTKEVAKIKATSELNELSAQLEQYSKNFGDLQELASTMKRLSIKHKAQEKHQPVKHKLRRTEDMKSPASKTSEDTLDDLLSKK
jgi:ABC-type transporter Mla subunit MlaD